MRAATRNSATAIAISARTAAMRSQRHMGQAVRMSEHPSSELPVPDVITRYFQAHDRRDAEAALSTFAGDARVFDDGREYLGVEAIRDWLTRASTEFSYTRMLLDASADETGRWLIYNRLEGNFPGGMVDLRYHFRLADGLIADLVIEP